MRNEGSLFEDRRIKKGSLCHSGIKNLTKVESEVLELITVHYMTSKQVAIRRKTTIRSVQKTIKNLIKKGHIERSNIGRFAFSMRSQKGLKRYRLHGQEYNIRILSKSNFYDKLKKQGKTISIDNNTVRLYTDSIEIYSSQVFWGNDPQEANSISINYWNRFFRLLENDLRIIILKSRSQNIKLVNQHFAEINNELAKDCHSKRQNLNFYDEKDQKRWLTVDNSLNLHEMETLHPNSAKKDMDKLKKQFDDFRNNDPPTLTQLSIMLKELTEINKETAQGLNSVVRVLKLTVPQPDGTKPNYMG